MKHNPKSNNSKNDNPKSDNPKNDNPKNNNTKNNQRQHLRTTMCVNFKLFHPVLGERTVATRDLSDGGVYLILEDPGVLPVGARVSGQVLGLMDDPPLVEMEVVRVDAAGLGLRFVNAEAP